MCLDKEYLEPAGIITINQEVKDLAADIAGGSVRDADQARALFYWVRDRIRYNPYSPFHRPEHYWPQTTLARGEGYCVQKSALLVALARARGLPARLIFADIINHRFSDKLLEFMGTTLFTYHAYVELRIDGRWVKITPSFEKELADRLDIFPVEFDGKSDAILHRLDRQGRVHIEYLRHIGVSADVPLKELLAAWEKTYGQDRVDYWKSLYREAVDK